jgi:hypothetical protein
MKPPRRARSTTAKPQTPAQRDRAIQRAVRKAWAEYRWPYDPITHEIALDMTYDAVRKGVPLRHSTIVPPKPYTSMELAVRLTVIPPLSTQHPGWANFEAARTDAHTLRRERDCYPSLALYNSRLRGYALVLNADRAGALKLGKGYRLVLLVLFESCEVDTWVLTTTRPRRPVVFGTVAQAVLWMEEMFRTVEVPKGWRWTQAPDGVPPVTLVTE